MSPSPFPVLGIEDGSYFTILKKSIYNCQKKMGLIPKKLQVDFTKEKAQSTVSCRDLDFSYLHSFVCDLVTSVATWFLAVALISGRDINYSRDLVGSVVFKN